MGELERIIRAPIIPASSRRLKSHCALLTTRQRRDRGGAVTFCSHANTSREAREVVRNDRDKRFA